MGHHGGYRKRHGISGWLSRLFGGQRHGQDRYYGEERGRHGSQRDKHGRSRQLEEPSAAQQAPASQQKKCPQCRIPIDTSAKFCPGCGTELTAECKKCSATLFASSKFCPECGTER